MQRSGERTGIHRIQHAIHEQCSGPQTRVLLKSWRDCMADLADRIQLWRPESGMPRITIIGYSYGGYTATLLADQLGERGLAVENLLLIDPVWRPRPSWASPLSLYRGHTISVAPNVRHLWHWHQIARRACEPQGHRLNVTNKTTWHTKLAPPCSCNHVSIDDQPQIKRKALEVACPC